MILYRFAVIFLFLFFGRRCSKKPVSNRIEMKFVRIGLQVNMLQVTDSDSDFVLTSYFNESGRDIMFAEKCCHMVSAHAASTRRICSSVHQLPTGTLSIVSDIRPGLPHPLTGLQQFYGPNAIPATQPTASKRLVLCQKQT